MAGRKIKRLHAAARDDIGDLRTQRPLPSRTLDALDPFLFLNHHGPQHYPPGNRGLPFGPHPHRGFETVTFILEGELTHLDSAGHRSVITAGGMQWMTAGSGLVHAEVSSDAFKEAGGALEILQLWVNLPARLKMVPPRYIGLQKEEIPSFTTDGGAVVDLISGSWEGRNGPVPSLTDVHMMVLRMPEASTLRIPIAPGRTVFLYVVRGALRIGEHVAPALHLVELEESGDELSLEAAEASVLLFGHAPPLSEPVVAHGPFVMNTREEIVQAIRDYQAGKFGAP